MIVLSGMRRNCVRDDGCNCRDRIRYEGRENFILKDIGFLHSHSSYLHTRNG